mmetsp:Transcript_67500/g.161995  ORF Transcript_67500/g.161995 Transcript_67500/m.161995 type:complete len:539 (+) Transcript_67500:70-1686(+)
MGHVTHVRGTTSLAGAIVAQDVEELVEQGASDIPPPASGATDVNSPTSIVQASSERGSDPQVVVGWLQHHPEGEKLPAFLPEISDRLDKPDDEKAASATTQVTDDKDTSESGCEEVQSESMTPSAHSGEDGGEEDKEAIDELSMQHDDIENRQHENDTAEPPSSQVREAWPESNPAVTVERQESSSSEGETPSSDSGDPPVPSEPPHVVEATSTEVCQKGDTIWKVVGGEESGGLLVRVGRLLTATLLDERLAPGSVVCGKEVDGSRLKYELISGRGPQSGWVSIRARGKDLLAALDAGGFSKEPSSLRSEPTRRSVIIFDWDDTLCPTAWLDQQPELRAVFNGNGAIDASATLAQNTQVASLLKAFETVLKDLLTLALSVACVGIVTLSQRSWVTDSARDLFPEVRPLLDKMEIVYAREQGGFQSSLGGFFPISAFIGQKRTAMQHVMDLHGRRSGVNVWESFISVGDSEVERQAAFTLAQDCVRQSTLNSWKLVKFLERPGIGKLRRELESLIQRLEELVSSSGNQNISHQDLLCL